ncbi:hypothetical protein QC762_609530 [Podospora pseudocomata]|uniref:DUF4238 domain-containing protein n=1 Tax=Podospora pseudocomata TaxID=2093779 RepID=A0ABR0G904_9PEZI|nr:hypothetical protein QC762_609530 [Podospora pseudocomata]
MTSQSPQYQHFVPQFLLRNFSHPYKPDGPTKGRKFQKGMFPKDKVVRHVDFAVDPPVICESPVNRILGLVNMYDNPNKPTALQREVEILFSKLEHQASQIFRKISKAFEQKSTVVSMSRAERDLMRKFLFLLMYRNRGFHTRFNHATPDGYNEDDKELVREYMRKNNIITPLDVWLDGIKTIIELPMDPGKKWLGVLMGKMYPQDAMWFWLHAEFSYMAILTPAEDGDEFILTDNAYAIFEGPNTSALDAETQEVIDTEYLPLHTFAPISPKLLIVLRADIFPDPLEDADERVREARKLMRLACRAPLESPGSEKVRSLLADLPISKARNNYTVIVDSRLELKAGQPPKRRQTDRFDFTIFPVKQNHVNMINGIFLDSCAPCTSIVFESRDAFARTLEWYLTAPCSMGKVLGGKHKEIRRRALFKLEAISRALGSQKETKWQDVEEVVMDNVEQWRAENLDKQRNLVRLMNADLDGLYEGVHRQANKYGRPFNSKSYGPYFLLGGSRYTAEEDFAQANLIRRFRIKIDLWSKGMVDEVIRQRNRDLIETAYLRLPPRRVWMLIKLIRLMLLAGPDKPVDLKLAKSEFDGPEDTIARVHHLVTPKVLNDLLWRTHINDMYSRRNHGVDIWARQNGGWDLAAWEMPFLHHIRGSIRNCGIPAIEKFGLEVPGSPTPACTIDTFRDMRPTDIRKTIVELNVRKLAELEFDSLFDNQVECHDLLMEFKRLFFQLSYPTPPYTWLLEMAVRAGVL